MLSISVKSGGDRFTGTWYSDYVSESQLTDNVPDYLRQANTPTRMGFYSRLPTGLCFERSGEQVCGGNAVKKQYDLNGDVGGPIVKQKAWFFTSWRLNDKYAYITGLGDEVERSKLSNKYTFKGTFQVGRNNQIIGYLNKREKLQDKRGINLTTPLSAAYYQSSRNYPWKVEGTRVLGSRAFLDVLYGNWYNFFPLRPVRDFGLYDGPWTPPRQDTSSAHLVGHRRQQRLPGPEALQAPVLHHAVVLQGWLEGLARPAHRLRLEARSPQPLQRSAVRHLVPRLHRRRSGEHLDPGRHLQFVGHRHQRRRLHRRLDQRHVEGLQPPDLEPRRARRELQGSVAGSVADPERHPGARRHRPTRAYIAFIAPKDVQATTVANTTTLAPKFGFAYDLSGDNRTVIKGFIGQSRWNSADTLADQENPVGLAQLRYAFVSCAAGQTTGCDLNGDRLVSSPAELGAFQSTQGGGGFVRVDRDLIRPTSNEVSLNLEREISTGLSGRASWVYKNMRNVWGEIDVARAAGYTVPFTINDPGADRVVGTGDDQTFQTLALAAGTGDRSRLHQRRAQQRRLPHRGVRVEPPLLGQVDDADVGRLHLVDDDHTQGARPPAAASSIVRST